MQRKFAGMTSGPTRRVPLVPGLWGPGSEFIQLRSKEGCFFRPAYPQWNIARGWGTRHKIGTKGLRRMAIPPT
jgi:hypothetical protein